MNTSIVSLLLMDYIYNFIINKEEKKFKMAKVNEV